MHRLGLIMIFAVSAGCEEQNHSGLKQGAPLMESSFAKYENLNVGLGEIDEEPVHDVIPKLQEALNSTETGLRIMISQNYMDSTSKVSFPEGNYTVKSLASKFCDQVDGSWKITKGKGVHLVFSHSKDSSLTIFSNNLDHDWRQPEDSKEDKADFWR